VVQTRTVADVSADTVMARDKLDRLTARLPEEELIGDCEFEAILGVRPRARGR